MQVKRVVQAGFVYFAVVFAAGVALGSIRVPWLVPLWGERYAELFETPFMLVVIFVAARGSRMDALAGWKQRLLAGLVALTLLVWLELTVVSQLRGLSLDEYLAQRDPVAGAVYLSSLLIFAIAPAVFSRQLFSKQLDIRDRNESPAARRRNQPIA